MKKSFLKIIIYTLIVIINTASNALASEFKDVGKNFWAYDAINEVTDEQVMNGSSSNMFNPEKFVTRAEYAEYLIKALKQEDLTVTQTYNIKDVNSDNPAKKYILRALNLDILELSSDGYFYPNDYVTRSEMITFLVNLLRTEHITKQEALLAIQEKYKDYDTTPDWFLETAGKAEIINVIANEPERENYLDYDKNLTKAQMAVFLSNMKKETDKIEQEKITKATSPKISEGIIIENTQRDGDIVTIPARTLLPIMIEGQISTKNANPGQMFKAKFANNITSYEHYLLFSKDLLLIGKVLNVIKGKYLVRNGEILFEFSGINNNNLYTKILGIAECETPKGESNKIAKTAKSVLKGENYTLKDGQIIYIKLYRPIRVNIVTNAIFD